MQCTRKARSCQENITKLRNISLCFQIKCGKHKKTCFIAWEIWIRDETSDKDFAHVNNQEFVQKQTLGFNKS